MFFLSNAGRSGFFFRRDAAIDAVLLTAAWSAALAALAAARASSAIRLSCSGVASCGIDDMLVVSLASSKVSGSTTSGGKKTVATGRPGAGDGLLEVGVARPDPRLDPSRGTWSCWIDSCVKSLTALVSRFDDIDAGNVK